jgi:hypothetical protein
MKPEPDEVYVALIEVVPMNPDVFGPDARGAFVRCYVLAHDPWSAAERCKLALDEIELSVVDVDWCVKDSETDWENSADDADRALAEEALSTGGVVFGEFQVWTGDDEETAQPKEPTSEAVFALFIEVAPMAPEALEPGARGAFVRCYVLAEDAESATAKCKRALGAKSLFVARVTSCVPATEIEWNDPDDTDEELIEKALATGEVISSEFHAWGAQ